jgi:hypothetical protein
MAGQIVIAAYRAKSGKEGALESLIGRHVPTLRRLGLATKRPVTLLKSFDHPTYLEIFEWADEHAAEKAHHTKDVAVLWEEMGKVCDFTSLGALPEAAHPFPHFRPVDGVTA